MKILWDNIIDSATITSNSEATGYDDDYITDVRLSKKYRSTGDTSEWLKFAFDTVQSVDYCALLGHNLSEDAVVTLQGNNSDSWGAPSFSQEITLSDKGNFYCSYRVGGKVYQDITNSYSGTVPSGWLTYSDGTYGDSTYAEGSVYETIALDLRSESEVVWEAYGSVSYQARDSVDGSSWGAWTSKASATTVNRRTKVSRYMQLRIFFTSPAWGDTTSYFKLLTPQPEVNDIIIDDITRAAYKYWRITIADSNNTDGYIELGRVFLGTALDMPGMNISKIVAKKTNSTYIKSITGQIYSNERIDLKYAEIPFNTVEDDDKNNIERFSDYCGITKPFVLLIWENDLDIEPPIYCNCTEKITFRRDTTDYLTWAFTLKFEECK